MRDFDVFNGDADGICALHQLRLAEPRAADLITGVKRDIALLKRVPAGAGDEGRPLAARRLTGVLEAHFGERWERGRS